MFPTPQMQQGRPVTPTAPTPSPAGAPGAGPQPPMGGGGAPGAGGAMQQVPPEFARHIDPGNQFQMTLMQRVDKLTPQDLQAVNTGIAPPAVQVLKKVIPEIGFLLDMIGKPGGGQPGAMPMPPGGMPAAPAGGAPPPMAPPAGLPQPGTKLGGV